MLENIRQDSNVKLFENEITTAARLWIVNHLCFNGQLGRPYWQKPQADRLCRLREKRLKHVRAFQAPPNVNTRFKLEKEDCFEAIAKSPPGALLFLDPPYLADKSITVQPHLKRKGLSGADYACGENWGREKHTELCKVLKSHPRWILCHRDHPVIRELYRDYQMVEYQDGKVWAGSSAGKRVELLICSPWVSKRW